MLPLNSLIDLNSNTILLPPNSQSEQYQQLEQFLTKKTGQMAITSSGTTGVHMKGFIFHKSAILENAKAVIRHLNLDTQDPTIVWGNCLPTHLIAGAANYLRASLGVNKTPVELGPCHGKIWWNQLLQHKISVVSLVPRQLNQLVQFLKQYPAHPMTDFSHLRYIMVGGDFLNSKLHQDALSLGLPIIRTYSLTEAGPQVACEKSPNQGLELLDIVEVQMGASGEIKIKTPSLFHDRFEWNPNLHSFVFQNAAELIDTNNYFATNDLGEIQPERRLQYLGRKDGSIKLRGRLFSLQLAKSMVQDFAYQRNFYGLIDLSLQFNDQIHPEQYSLNAVIANELRPLKNEIEAQLTQLLNPHKIDHFYWSDAIATNDMGKTLWKQ
jgi:long-subunit acyl-CoA synthetase (AMP-forming)